MLHLATQRVRSAGQTSELDRLLLEQRSEARTDIAGPTCQQNNRLVLVRLRAISSHLQSQSQETGGASAHRASAVEQRYNWKFFLEKCLESKCSASTAL